MELGNARLPTRFWSKVELSESGCWLWTGSIHRTGYARIKWGDRSREAHIVSYVQLVGPVSDGLQLDHTCHDPRRCVGGWGCIHRRCVNPAHLAPVTQRQNNQRGRSQDKGRERLRKNAWGSQPVTCPSCGAAGTMRHRKRHERLHLAGS